MDGSVGSVLGGFVWLALFEYSWDDAKIESLLNISWLSKDLSAISIKEKINYLGKLGLSVHKSRGDVGSFIFILQIMGPFCVQLYTWK